MPHEYPYGMGKPRDDRNSPGHELQQSRQALERTQRAQEAIRAAAEARDQALRRLRLTYMAKLQIGGGAARARDQGADQEEIATREKQLEEYRQQAINLEDEAQRAAAEEQEAREEWAAASMELQQLTVGPRVEAAKLRFEEHKLRATLSSASIVGIAATSGILLPDNPTYVGVLVTAFLCLFVSTGLSLRAMKETSGYAEGTLISGDVAHPAGTLAWLTRHTFTAGLVLFGAFVVLNLLF